MRYDRKMGGLATALSLLLAACSGGVPVRIRLTGTSSTLPDSVRGTSAIAKTSLGTWDGERARDRFGDRPLLIEGTVDSYSAAGSETPTLWLKVPAGTAPAYLKGPVPLERRQAGERVKLLCDRVEVTGGTLHFQGCLRDLR